MIVEPVPTTDELVAIVAGIDALWPRPVILAVVEDRVPAWRFSSHWWARPVAARRERPWH